MDEAILWEMKRRTAAAVQSSYEGDDMEAMGMLAPLEQKICQVLSERMR